MREIEVKILDVDVKKIIQKIKKLGAVKTFEGKMVAHVYDFPGNTLKKKGRLLRLRTRGNKTELTFKRKIKFAKAKIAEEHEVVLSDEKTLHKILKGIGLFPVRRVVKKRIAYSLGKIHFDIDTYSAIPAFLEIEAPSVKEIEKWVKKLGFAMKEAKPWTGRQVLEYYKKSRS